MSESRGRLIRWSALAIVIGLPLVLVGIGMSNLVFLLQSEPELAQQRDQLARLRTRVGLSPINGEAQDTTPIFLTSASRSLAGAELQQRVVALISAHSGRVVETQTGEIDLSEADSQDTVRLRSTFEIDNADLFALVTTIESGLPLLDIESVSIRPAVRSVDDSAAETSLRVDMQVVGWIKVAGA